MDLKRAASKPYTKKLQAVIDLCNARKFPSTSMMQRLSLSERSIAQHYIDCLSKETADKIIKLVGEENTQEEKKL